MIVETIEWIRKPGDGYLIGTSEDGSKYKSSFDYSMVWCTLKDGRKAFGTSPRDAYERANGNETWIYWRDRETQ